MDGCAKPPLSALTAKQARHSKAHGAYVLLLHHHSLNPTAPTEVAYAFNVSS